MKLIQSFLLALYIIRAREPLLLCLVTELVILGKSAVGKKQATPDLELIEKTPIRTPRTGNEKGGMFPGNALPFPIYING